MVIKQYGYFKKDAKQQQEIDRFIFAKFRYIDKKTYYKVLQDLRLGRIEYEPIEFHCNKLVGLIVVSNVLSKYEISFHTNEKNILLYDAAYVAALISQGLKQGWLYYLPD